MKVNMDLNPTVGRKEEKTIIQICEFIVIYLFRCMDFICSCYLDKHPSLCEQFS